MNSKNFKDIEEEEFNRIINNGLNNNTDNSASNNNCTNNNKPLTQPKPAMEFAPDQCNALLIFSLLIAIFYAICFAGINKLPLISFTLFCTVLIPISYIGLSKLDLIHNKKAFLLSIPIFIVSIFNGIIEYSAYTYYNVIVMHILFALMLVKATAINPLTSLRELISRILGTIFGRINSSVTIIDFAARDINKQGSNKVAKILLGIIIALPVMVLLILLLTSADAVFNNILSNITDYFNFNTFIIYFINIILVIFYILGYVYALKTKKAISLPAKKFKGDVIVAVTFLTPINILFLVFCYIQVVYLFTNGLMSLPEGMIYSEYAREGFFQLLFVTFINFSILLIFITQLKDIFNHKAIKLSLLFLSLFTVILIASSFYRMGLYISEYGFTPLRVEVLIFLTAETICILLTLIYIIKDSFPILKIYIVTLFTGFLILNICATNYFSTKLNITLYNNTGNINYINTEDMEHDSIPLIIDLYQNPDLEFDYKEKLFNRVKILSIRYEKSKYNSYWQNFNLSQYNNQQLARDFISEHK